MNSTASALLEDETDASVSDNFHVPNAQGVYENAEQIFVKMEAGNICHFLLASTAAGYVVGFKFFTRQPHNLLTELPKVGQTVYPDRAEALRYLVHCAGRFFIDHARARSRLQVWASEHVKPIGGRINAAVAADREQSYGDGVMPVGVTGDAPLVTTVPPSSGAASASHAPEDHAADAPVRPHYAEIPVDEIERNPNNPRKQRSEAALADLVESIRAQGELLQPIAVRDMGAGRAGKADTKRYQLIFGEGRWVAVQRLGWAKIDAKVYTGINADDALAKALVENLQREDMNAMDEAEGFAELARLGWDPDRMAEQTGKALITIQKAISLNKLPDGVRALVRSLELSARQARSLIRWISRPNNTTASVGFVPRPQVCEVIAQVASKSQRNISSDRLEEGVPAEAVGALLTAKLIAEIPAQYHRDVTEGQSEFRADGRLYTFNVEHWKNLKKQIDAAAREAARKATEKVRTKVENQVSVPVAELKRSRVNAVELVGADEIYADYLPQGACTRGIADSQAEVMVCLRPDLLKQLQTAERQAIAEADGRALEAARERATAKIRKIKKVGAREITFLLAELLSGGSDVRDGWSLDVWKRQGAKFPSSLVLDHSEVARRTLLKARLADTVLVRVCLESSIAPNLFRETLEDNLRYLLETPKLGLFAEDPKARAQLLASLSERLWPAPMEERLEKPAKGGKK